MTDPLLDTLKTVPRVTKAARLRALMPEIERQVSGGARWEDIIAHLNAGGLEVTRETFKSYLYRYRRNQRSASAQPANPQTANAETIAPERITDRNTGTDPEPIMDGNPDGETPKPESDSEAETERRFEDAFDPKKRDAYADQFMNQRPILIGRNRSDKK